MSLSLNKRVPVNVPICCTIYVTVHNCVQCYNRTQLSNIWQVTFVPRSPLMSCVARR